MKLTPSEKIQLNKFIGKLLENEAVKEMQQYIQHGNTTTYYHCLSVASCSYWLCLRLGIKCDISSVTRGAILHDLYLYDWHVPHDNHRLHGFYHSGVALDNARKYFDLTPIEESIIETHMWPLTITKVPLCKEAVIVCIVDKLCSVAEIIKNKKVLC